MRIPEEVLQAIRSRVSAVDVVGRHVGLKRAGKNWKGLCPFHAEKTPSFVVNEERGTYHCFGCGAGGSVFRFVMEVEGRTFLEAVQLLAAEAGVALDLGPEDPARREQREERAQLLEILGLAARYYRHQLQEGRAGERARAYLARREVPAPAAESFALGCAPPGWDNLARFLGRKGVDPALACRAGLLAERASGGYYDRLRDRLVFPIHDGAGRVVSFGGRILGEGEPKYLNGPESPVFRKGELLYGLWQGRETLRRSRRALLVEGYLDVISLHARGHAGALATLGTSLTREHLQTLRRWADEAVLVYDGDRAGRQAAFRSLDVFLGEGFAVRGVLLPAQHDPDSLVRAGGDLEALVAEAEPLFELYLADLAERYDLDSVDGQLGAVKEAAPRLAPVDDPLARDLYYRRAAEVLGVDEARLRERVAPAPRRPGGPAPAPAAVELDPVERQLLEALIRDARCRAEFVADEVDAWMGEGPLRDAARFVAGRSEPAGLLPLEQAPAAARQVLSAAAVDAGAQPAAFGVLKAKLCLRALERRAAHLLRDLGRAEAAADQARVAVLLGEKQALDRELAECRRAAAGRAPG